MTCTHLQQLYQLCRDSQIQLSSTDLIHIVCKQCENIEVCPSVLYEEYEQMPQSLSAATESLPSATESLPRAAGPSAT